MKHYLFCLPLLILAACQPQEAPTDQAFLEKLANRPVTCEAGDDCDMKWNRAIEFVETHSEYKIRIVSDNLIQTRDMVSDTGRPVKRYPYYTVVKYKQNKHSYVMKFTSACDSEFKCAGSVLRPHAEFATYIMGPPPGVTETSPGVYHIDDRDLNVPAGH